MRTTWEPALRGLRAATRLALAVACLGATSGLASIPPLPVEFLDTGTLSGTETTCAPGTSPDLRCVDYNGTGNSAGLWLRRGPWRTQSAITITSRESEPVITTGPGTVTWTDAAGDEIHVSTGPQTLSVTLQGSELVYQVEGAFVIAGGTGRYAGAAGSGRQSGEFRFRVGTREASYSRTWRGDIQLRPHSSWIETTVNGYAVAFSNANGLLTSLVPPNAGVARTARLRLVFDPATVGFDRFPADANVGVYNAGLLYAELRLDNQILGAPGFGTGSLGNIVVNRSTTTPASGSPFLDGVEFRSGSTLLPGSSRQAGPRWFLRYGCSDLLLSSDAAPATVPVPGSAAICGFGITAFTLTAGTSAPPGADNYLFATEPYLPPGPGRTVGWYISAGTALTEGAGVSGSQVVLGRGVLGDVDRARASDGRTRVEASIRQPNGGRLEDTRGSASVDLPTRTLRTFGDLTSFTAGSALVSAAEIQEILRFRLPAGETRRVRFQLAVTGRHTTAIIARGPDPSQVLFPIRWSIEITTPEASIFRNSNPVTAETDRRFDGDRIIVRYAQALVLEHEVRNGDTIRVEYSLSTACLVLDPPTRCGLEFGDTAHADVLVPDDVTVESESGIFQARPIVDIDADMINDDFDNCPAVANPGQEDNDGDRVGDLCDTCPGSAFDATTDRTGCSAAQRDSDRDGVTDDIDLCPTTPSGLAVDTTGCAATQRDADTDGVSDAADRCPATPAGAAVDVGGCAASQRDSDADGINDAVDQCPGTASGATVGSDGCPPPVRSCDIDRDNDVDRKDIRSILDRLGRKATSPTDPADANRDGRIDVRDAAACILRCTKWFCASP